MRVPQLLSLYLLIHVVSACSATEVEEAVPVFDDQKLFVSGERLRARVEDGGGGAERFLGWWDAELEADCGFGPAEDGELRCLPRARRGLVYADPTCSEPIYPRHVGEPVPAYVVTETLVAETPVAEEPSSERRVIHELQQRHFTSSIYYRRLQESGECELRTSTGTERFHRVGAHAEPDRFVRAWETQSQRTADLDAMFTVAEDGASRLTGAFDRGRSDECWLAPYGFPDGACVPVRNLAFVIDRYYADAGCSLPLAYSYEDATVGVEGIFREGEPFLRFLSLGPEIASDEMYIAQSGACAKNPDSATDTKRYRLLGEELPPSAFPSITSILVGDGALRLEHQADSKGVPLRASGNFFDAETGEECSLDTTCDGARRCVNDLVIGSERRGPYSDRLCSVPIKSHDCGLDLSKAVISLDPNYLCDAGASVGNLFAVGPAYDGPIYDIGGLGQPPCVLQGPIDLDPEACYSEVGEPIDLERYPPVVERIE